MVLLGIIILLLVSGCTQQQTGKDGTPTTSTTKPTTEQGTTQTTAGLCSNAEYSTKEVSKRMIGLTNKSDKKLKENAKKEEGG